MFKWVPDFETSDDNEEKKEATGKEYKGSVEK